MRIQDNQNSDKQIKASKEKPSLHKLVNDVAKLLGDCAADMQKKAKPLTNERVTR